MAVTGAEIFIVDDEGGGVTGASSAPTFGSGAVDNQSYSLNTPITPLVLPAATGGVGTLTYALSPDPPAGLTFTASTRTLAGTPAAGQAATTYTYTATGSDAAADSIEFTIAVSFGCSGSTAVGGATSGGLVDDCEVLLASEATLVGAGPALNWDTGTAMHDWHGSDESPRTRFNIGPSGVRAADLSELGLAGSIPPELAGLSSIDWLSLAGNSLTGPIPPELGGLSSLITLRLEENSLTGPIPAELGDLYSLKELFLQKNSLTGAIPPELGSLTDIDWLDLRDNSLTGCIPGPVHALSAGTDGLEINPQKNGVNLPRCAAAPVLTLTPGDGEIAASWTAPAGATPTGYDLEYRLSSDAGWSDAGHTGTDTTATIGSLTNDSEYSVRVRATTADGNGDWSETAMAAPAPDATPDFGSATVANQSFPLNTAITDLVLPAATGGNGTLAYTLSPDPPAGLTFTASTRTLSGTPTAGQGPTEYTYRVTDGDTNTGATDADSLKFTIAVSFGCTGSTAVGGSEVTSGPLVDDCETLLAAEATLVGAGDSINWDPGRDMNRWSARGLDPGIIANRQSGVVSFWARGTNWNLQGTIPPVLGNLSSVQTFHLFQSSVTGPIPPELGKLSDLGVLVLQENSLTGPIPAELGNLSSLTDLFLQENSLTGSIPAELGKISGLNRLRLHNNSLTGCVPVALERFIATIYPQKNGVNLPPCVPTAPTFGDLTVANQSYTANTKITNLVLPAATRGNGPLTYTLTPDLPAGLLFDAETRTLSGTPAAGLGATTYTWKVTDADANTAAADTDSLQFTIAVSFGCAGSAAVGGSEVTSGPLVDDCETLLAAEATLVGAGTGLNWDLNTDMNRWSVLGEDPGIIANRQSGVFRFWTRGTNWDIRGTIPPVLGDLSSVEIFYLAQSRTLTGSIPPELSRLSSLGLLFLQENSLTGSIPPELGNLSDLTNLDLRDNSLTGSIPPELGNLSSLVQLDLRNNSLTGCVPVALERFIATIYPQKNGVNLPPCVPTAPTFGDSTVANQSYAADTKITDLVLPAATSGNGPLTYTLTPDLPAGLSFDADTRTLSGTPTEGKGATTYTWKVKDADGDTVAADTDSLQFTIAVSFGCAGSTAVGGSWVTSGPLVDDCETLLAAEATLVGAGSGLNWDLDLSMNRWSQRIIDVPGIRANRESGVLGFRTRGTEWDLRGTIPPLLGNLSSVESFHLFQSSVTGAIPPELGKLTDLGVLVLQENSLTGPIPPELGNLSSLTDLFLHENSLTGSIPPELGNISGLNRLYLHGNSLTGCIPPALQKFASTINPQKNGVNLPVCPGVPVLALAAGDGVIAATWTVPAGRTPTGYDIEYKLSSASDWTDAGHTGTDTTAAIGPLRGGVEYSVRVRAKTADATGWWSEVVTATTAAESAPDFGSATVANRSYTVGTAIADLVLPAATGGNGTLAYTLSPDLPPGLTFTASTRTLSGTPTAGQVATEYTYRVADGDANTDATDADSLKFTITVAFACAGSTAVGGPSVMSGGLVDDCEVLLASKATLEGAVIRSTGTRGRGWPAGTV